MARPSLYNEELTDKICQRIAEGESLKKICESKDMPTRVTVHNWLLDKDKEEFFNKYEKAVNVRTENMFDALEEIADIPDESESPMRSRLRVDVRKWYLSKIMPKKYGDKMDLTTDGKPLVIEISKEVADKNDIDTEPEHSS